MATEDRCDHHDLSWRSEASTFFGAERGAHVPARLQTLCGVGGGTPAFLQPCKEG